MRTTAIGLTKAAAASAAVAGSIFIGVQIGHPASGSFTTETDQWVVRSVAKTVMCVLALAGITGLYLRQHRKAGLLGMAGYLLFTGGYLALLCVEVVAATVLPTLVDTQPGLVNDVVAAANGGAPAGDIGGMQVLLNLAGLGYIVGGLAFGTSLHRTRLVNRWAALLLAVSTTATATLAVLPESFNRPLAVPEGIALVALGISLWRHPSGGRQIPTRTVSTTTATTAGRVEHPVVL